MIKRKVKNFWFQAVVGDKVLTAISIYNLRSHCNGTAKAANQNFLFDIYYVGKKKDAKIGVYNTADHKTSYISGYRAAMRWVESE